LIRSRLLLCLVPAVFFPIVAAAADRCQNLERQFTAETPGADFEIERWIAAFLDLSYKSMDDVHARAKRNVASIDEVYAVRKALDCLDAELHLKEDRPIYEIGRKLAKAGCRNDAKGRSLSKNEAESLSRYESEAARYCVDERRVAQLRARLELIKTGKALTEEKETVAVKRAEATSPDSEVCRVVRPVTEAVPKLLKPITGRLVDKTFIEESRRLGLPEVKMSQMADIATYQTPLTLAPGFMAAKSACEIQVGTAADVTIRVEPNFSCSWTYKTISRKELEEKTDRLTNLVRGCYREVTERDSQLHRHDFVGDGTAEVVSYAYFGDGAPSSINLYIKKYAPKEDEACARYAVKSNPEDLALCARKHAR
jgi:hypothetical protein